MIENVIARFAPRSIPEWRAEAGKEGPNTYYRSLYNYQHRRYTCTRRDQRRFLAVLQTRGHPRETRESTRLSNPPIYVYTYVFYTCSYIRTRRREDRTSYLSSSAYYSHLLPRSIIYLFI